MNNRLENRLTMYEGLLTLLQENMDKINTIGGFSEAVTGLAAVIADVKAKSAEVDRVSAGKTTGKYDAEDALVSELIPACSALYIYGRKQNNAEIKERVSTTETKLRRMRDTELAAFGLAMADLALANIKGVAAFGLTEDKVNSLRAKAQAYNTAIGAKESSVADRKGARGAMNDLFDKADDILNEELDRFMEMLRSTETEFYNKYFAARVVKDTGVRHKPTNGTTPVPEPTK